MLSSRPVLHCLLLLLAAPVHAAAADKRIDAFQVDAAPVLDGVLDDDAWVFASVIEDFHQVDPDEFAPPTEQSLIFVVYTRDALYVGGRFYDREPDRINALVLRQGDFSLGEDSLTVMIDPFNQGRSGYAFDLTSNGVRSQAVYANVTKENWQWQGIWHGAAQRDGRGWTAEIEIPFKTLSFDPANDTWGLNFARYIGRKSEHIGWVSANHTQNPATSGQVSGMTGLEQGMGLDVVSGLRIGAQRDYAGGTSHSEVQPTIDAFYKLTPGLTAAITLNTDFSGTGVDERQINLTRFGLFVREQRGFFLQDADIFEFGRIGSRDYRDASTLSRVEQQSGRPFFSRRIGLNANGETVDIDAGAKLTGRVGRWDIGLLAIKQAGFDDVEDQDLFVARLAANVLAESSLGVIVTHGDPESNAGNTLAGLDFRYLNTRLAGGGTLEAQAWYQQTETPGLSGDAAAWGVGVGMPNATGWRGALAYKELQKNYRPALGFANRLDVRDASAELGYTHYLDSQWLRSVYAGVDAERIETLAGELESQVVTLRPLELTDAVSDKLAFSYALQRELLTEPFEIADGIMIPAAQYRFEQYCVNFASGDTRQLSGSAYGCGGDFYDGRQSSAGAELVWRPNAHLKLSASQDVYDTRLAAGRFFTRLSSLRADIAFTSTWYLENFLQYDNLSGSLGVNSILRWVPRAGRQLVLVVNRDFIERRGRRSFYSSYGDITLKFGYTLRF